MSNAEGSEGAGVGFTPASHSSTQLIQRTTVYEDIDEARAAAERLAQERGQA